ncbi:RICIN domain-containing protein [Streptomyces sp. NPDC050617]|uniref:RICIN domain-containing protein n=1 Tax=Streptomyces sp. NPDC050617 TaxID=3154628 RepID=UPI0034364DC9
MRRTRTRLGRGLGALIATATAAVGLAATPASAAPAAAASAAPAAGQAVQPGQTCTADDLGKRHPIIKTSEVAPTITHFKGWYVTEGSTGTQSVNTSTTETISVSVGLNGTVQGSFAVEALGSVGASLGLNVQVNYTHTSSTSQSISWNFRQPGYYGLYEGTKKVTGTYGSLNCNRVQQGDGSWALKWVEGPDTGSYTTYTTLEEGAVRCEDKVPASSIMARAQRLLDCGAATATAKHEAGPVPSAKTVARDAVEEAAAKKASGSTAVSRAAQGFTCDPGFYKIGVPDRPLYWTGPLLGADGVRLRPSTIFSGDLDQWSLCNKVERNGVIEATLVNHRSQWCLTVPAQNAANEGAALQTAPCAEDDLQRFYIYRDVPGSPKIGVQNKYTGSMMGHDRYADGEFIRQYSGGRQDGTGTYNLTGV